MRNVVNKSAKARRLVGAKQRKYKPKSQNNQNNPGDKPHDTHHDILLVLLLLGLRAVRGGRLAHGLRALDSCAVRLFGCRGFFVDLSFFNFVCHSFGCLFIDDNYSKFCKIYISDFDGAKELREQLMTCSLALRVTKNYWEIITIKFVLD